LISAGAADPGFNPESCGLDGFSLDNDFRQIKLQYDRCGAPAAAALFICLFCFFFQLSCSIVLFDTGMELSVPFVG